jgi:hypothetical protein
VAYAGEVRSAPPRTPNYLRFIVTGAIIGFIAGAAFALSGEGAVNYSTGSELGYFGVMFGGIGALVAGLVAVLLERRR